MRLDHVLSGEAGIAGVRWLLSGGPARAALRRALGGLLEGGHEVASCRLTRAKFKPGRKLSAYYDVRVRAGTDECTRPVAVTWPADGPATESTARGALEAEAVGRGVAAPFRRLEAHLPARAMHVLVSPLDERFPQLVRLWDPGYAGSVVCAGAPGGVSVTPIRYRPGQRHVLRVDGGSSGEARAVFAKLYADDRGARSARVAAHLAGWLQDSGTGLSALRPLAFLSGDNAVLYPSLDGVPLWRLLMGRGENPALALGRAGTLLAALHLAPGGRDDGLQTGSFDVELRLIARAGEHLDALCPSGAARMRLLLERARSVHEGLAQEPPTFVHGDVKLDHLWVGRAGLTLMDFDSAKIADPAFDLGKLLADLRWWHLTARLDGLEDAQRAFLRGYFEDEASPRASRARLYEALLLAKMALRRVRLFEPSWGARTESLIALAERLLADLGCARVGAAEPGARSGG